jgi:hypothetical protein
MTTYSDDQQPRDDIDSFLKLFELGQNSEHEADLLDLGGAPVTKRQSRVYRPQAKRLKRLACPDCDTCSKPGRQCPIYEQQMCYVCTLLEFPTCKCPTKQVYVGSEKEEADFLAAFCKPEFENVSLDMYPDLVTTESNAKAEPESEITIGSQCLAII